MALNPQQFALQSKSALEARGYAVDGNGNVRYPPISGSAIVPPWSWAQALPNADISLKLPGSDPNSAWHAMYSAGGPFMNRSTWDSAKGTYEGSTDWGNVLGVGAVGSLFAAPAIAGALGGSAGAGAAGGAAAGSGGAAGGAGVATAPAAAGWFSPANIIPSAISGIASIFGANQQANASSEAAQLQYKATEEALADARKQREYEQQQYANYLGRLQPYLSLGTNAGSALQGLLARSAYARTASGPTQAPMQVSAGPTAAPSAPPSSGVMGGGGTVTLKAPDGSVRQVPREQADHYTKLGAVAV